MLGRKPVINGGSGVRRSCAVESVLADKPSLDIRSELLTGGIV